MEAGNTNNKGIIIIILLLAFIFVVQKLPSPYEVRVENNSEEVLEKESFIKKCLEEQEFERIKCIALATDNVSLCETLERNGEVDERQMENCRFRYFSTQAVLNDNLSYCENLTGERIWICKVSVTYNDSFCSFLKETPEEVCIEFINRPIIPLENKSMIASDENSLNFYSIIAIKEKRPELCELWPIYRKARKCKVIANPKLKNIDYCNQDVLDQCEDSYYSELLKLTKPQEGCEKEQCTKLAS